jgi:hypothetical protein
MTHRIKTLHCLPRFLSCFSFNYILAMLAQYYGWEYLGLKINLHLIKSRLHLVV